MSKWPSSFNNKTNEAGKKLTKRNAKTWSDEQILEYNAINNNKYHMVKCSQDDCPFVGQRYKAKDHFAKKRCKHTSWDENASFITISVLNPVSQEWEEEKVAVFSKGKGKRNTNLQQEKKREREKGQSFLGAYFKGVSDPMDEADNIVDQKDDEQQSEMIENVCIDEDQKWDVLDSDINVDGDNDCANILSRINEPHQLLIRYGHNGLCLFPDDDVDMLYTVYCENCEEELESRDGNKYNWNDKQSRKAMKNRCFYHFDERSDQYWRHLQKKQPKKWTPIIKRSVRIMTNFFYWIIRMIQGNVGDAQWPYILADYHIAGADIGNRMHSHFCLPKMKEYLYDEALLMVQNSILEPLAATGSSAGFSISSDCGSKWNHGYEMHRVKSFHQHLGLPISVAAYQQPITNDPNDVSTTKTAKGHIKSKRNLFTKLKLTDNDVSEHCHGYHGDDAMHEVGMNVAGKMKDEFNLSDWYSHKSDVCHEIERVVDQVT